jgi:hypothetical protein
MSEEKRSTSSLPVITPDFGEMTPMPPPPPPSGGGRRGGGEPPPSRPPLRPEQEGDEAPRRRATGCGFVAALTLVITAGLVTIGLLLPPISIAETLFGARFVPFTREANAVREVTLTVAVYGEDVGENFAVAISSISQEEFSVAGTSRDGAIRTAFQALPGNSEPISPLYTLSSSGTPPERITLSLTITDRSVPDDDISLYGYEPETFLWRFIPSTRVGNDLIAQVDRLPRRLAALRMKPISAGVIASISVDQVLSPDVARFASVVAPAGLQPTLTGDLTGNLAPGFSLTAAYLVTPAIRNYVDPRVVDVDTLVSIFSSTELTRRHNEALLRLAVGEYDGLLIDYRDLPPELRPAFSAFITLLGEQMRALRKVLVVAVPPAVNTPNGWDTGAYDWQVIGAAADAVLVGLPTDPAAYAPGEDRLVEAMLRWAVDQIDRQKMYPVVSALSQRQVGDGFTSIPIDQALSPFGNVRLEAPLAPGDTLPPETPFTARLDGFPAQVQNGALAQPYVEYLDENGGVISRVWVTTGSALRARIDAISRFHVAGIALDDLNSPGIAPGVMNAVLDYSLNLPGQPTPFNLNVRWTVESSARVVDTIIRPLNAPLAVTIAPQGNFAINAAIVSGSGTTEENAIVVPREGARISVFVATATPTPSPTPTPTLTPTPAPTNAPAAQPSGGNQPAFRPGPGSITVGQFEYGGHVTGTETGAVGAMQRAGMSWMKVQLRYGPGADPGIAGTWISQAHSRGFKILIGIVGSPNDLRAGGADYIRQFAAFAGAVAGQGADAIEIWNEANIDREWPNGLISGSAYLELLAPAYQAIKSANSGTMVISAAPAPTGAEAAFPGAVVNDDRWLRQFVEAGGLNSTDCVGVHYNEGVVPASATSGDPRDNYYTRYLPTMLNTYWGIINGAKPLCFTELGYLTPEGYPPLDPYFAWGANTTVAQQAAWLAEAAAFLSQSGRVRLMIIWNVDYQAYGADPMGGFAIVRPNGSCPACDALAAAR